MAQFIREDLGEPYKDSPPSSPMESSIDTTRSKPLPPIPVATDGIAYEDQEPLLPQTGDGQQAQDLYHDEPRSSSDSDISTPPYYPPQRFHIINHRAIPVYFPPYRDEEPLVIDSDDVPLAHLVPPYPVEAPPSYNVVVREAYRDTLIQHMPSHIRTVSTSGSVTDVEVGRLEIDLDNPSHRVEKWVALTIVWLTAATIGGIAIWQVLLIKRLL